MTHLVANRYSIHKYGYTTNLGCFLGPPLPAQRCVMGEGFFFGAVAVLGGLVLRYMKTHPHYKHKSQKLKDAYQEKLHQVLSVSYGDTKAYWVSRALADYIFDFGRRLYVDHHVEKHEGYAQKEKEHLSSYRIETPEVLCEQLVQRAVELNIPVLRFQNHVQEMWNLMLIPVGQLTPASVKRIPGADAYVSELQGIRLTQAQMHYFLEKSN